MAKYAFGVDIGGTTVKMGLLNTEGELLDKWEIVTRKEDKGEHIACLEARKHFAWYLRGVAYANYYKEKISHIGTMDDIYAIAAGIKRALR